MRFKIASVVLAVLALTAPVAFAGGLTLRLDTRERQTARELKVKLTCFDNPCTVEVTGKARVGTKKFAIRPKERSLPVDGTERFMLRIEKLRKLEALLVDRDGQATVKARGTSPEGVSAKLKVEITLKG